MSHRLSSGVERDEARAPFPPTIAANAQDDPDPVEAVLRRVLDALHDDRPPSPLGRRHELAAAVAELEHLLRSRAQALVDMSHDGWLENGVGVDRLRRHLDHLAGRAEAHSAFVATGTEPEVVLTDLEELVASAHEALDREADVWLDRYWLDLGIAG